MGWIFDEPSGPPGPAHLAAGQCYLEDKARAFAPKRHPLWIHVVPPSLRKHRRQHVSQRFTTSAALARGHAKTNASAATPVKLQRVFCLGRVGDPLRMTSWVGLVFWVVLR